jgi:hypothetical protein
MPDDVKKTLLNGLDVALAAHMGRLFSVFVDPAGGANAEERFTRGLRNAITTYEKAAAIIEQECEDE